MIKTVSLSLLLFLSFQVAIAQIPDSIPSIPSSDTSTMPDIPTVTLDQLVDNSETDGDTYSVLSASRDAFESAITFTLGQYRYRFRGYDGRYNQFMLNYAPLNDMVLGFFPYGSLGGLSNILYNRNNAFGLENSSLSIGEIGGVQSIDTRAGSQRKRFQATYSFTNGSYNHRLMLTYNTGVTEKGWAVSLSLNRRWAQEGYVEGTFTDTYSYFASVEKFFKEKHRVSASIIANAGRRGRNSGSIQELYDLAGSNFYNSYWGFQDGKKRNSRVLTVHQPIISLNYEYKDNADLIIRNAAYAQVGKYGTTALDWYEAADPRAEYYQNLPSFEDNAVNAGIVEQAILDDPNLIQVDWDELYNSNYNSLSTVENADNIEGNTLTGRQAKYVLQERRSDILRFGNAVSFEWNAAERLTLNGGANYAYQQTHYYNRLNDLLGAEFHVDLNNFADRDFPDDIDKAQNDLNNPNRIVREGDIYGNNYKANVSSFRAWMQSLYTLKKVDLSLSAAVGHNRFYRNGEYRTGFFPENSFGQSEKQNFVEYQFRGNVTYKITGKHYLYAAGGYQAKAPTFRDAFLSPRTRNSVIPDLKTEKILSLEAGYLLKSSDYKARAVFYYTSFADKVQSLSFFDDREGNFVNYSLTGIGIQHIGAELMAEAKVYKGLTASVVAVLGRHTYNTRPTSRVTVDNSSEVVEENQIIYMDNYYVGGYQQNAGNFNLTYRSPKYWRIGMDVTYLNGVWIGVNPARRTVNAVDGIEENSEQWNAILDQQKTDPAFTLGLNGGYSWKMDKTVKGMKKSWFMYLNISISNALNKTDIVTGGFEQLRFDNDGDPERFPRRYYYARGLSAFINLSFRL